MRLPKPQRSEWPINVLCIPMLNIQIQSALSRRKGAEPVLGIPRSLKELAPSLSTMEVRMHTLHGRPRHRQEVMPSILYILPCQWGHRTGRGMLRMGTIGKVKLSAQHQSTEVMPLFQETPIRQQPPSLRTQQGEQGDHQCSSLLQVTPLGVRGDSPEGIYGLHLGVRGDIMQPEEHLGPNVTQCVVPAM